MKFFIKTYGCQMNVNDSEKISTILKNYGLVRAETEESADCIIINSCAVREKSQDKIFSFIGRIDGKKKIIVTGCVAQAEKDNVLKKSAKVSLVVGTHRYNDIGQLITGLGTKKKEVFTDFSSDWIENIPLKDSRENQVSGYVSIMEGCNNFCSYCIVPFTRGREKYRPFRNVVKEAESLSREGFKEIILLGQNVNNWKSSDPKMNFPDLLRYLAENIEVKWIRFITSCPGYHDEEIIGVMKDFPKIARQIHFPVQSGSTRILNRMNRTYTREQYLRIIQKFYQEIPDIKFSSDFIVGFPQETENDFNLTLSLVEKVEFENIFSFIYSPRKYTKAAETGEKISLSEKKERLYRLQKLQGKIQLKNNQKLIGKELEVMVTGRNHKKEGEVKGRTVTNRVVNFKSEAAAGEFKKVLVKKVGSYSLRGIEV